MSDHTPDNPRLQALLAQASDQSLSAEQRVELAAVLSGDPRLIERYVSYLSVDALLQTDDAQRRLASQGAAADHRVADRAPHAAHAQTSPSGAARTWSSRLSDAWRGLDRRAAAWCAVAATLLVLAVPTVWRLRSPAATVVPGGLAADAPLAAPAPVALGSDWWTLDEGAAAIAFRSGARVVVEGPAQLRVRTGNSCELRYGALAAYVPAEARGFAVEVAGARVVDLGTAFRVTAVNDGAAAVHVTEGSVRLQPAHGESLLLPAGRGARWTASQPPRAVALTDLVPAASPSVIVANLHPRELGFQPFEPDDRAFVFLERAETTLPHDLALDVERTGEHGVFHGPQGLLAEGSTVRSFLVHFCPSGRQSLLSGSITFAEPILGIVCQTDRLNATNSILGDPVGLRCEHHERGMESRPDRNSDVVVLSEDRRTITFRFRTMSIDQMRVLTAVER